MLEDQELTGDLCLAHELTYRQQLLSQQHVTAVSIYH